MLRAGALPRLRTALLLLDNCTEVLLDRWIEDRLAHEDMERRIKTRATEAGIPEDHPHFADLFSKKFLTASDSSRVARYFNEKLKYTSEMRGALAPTVASVLLHIHRYRNESYHGGRVRTGILRTTVAIQVHLVCDLIQTLKPGSAGYSSSEDFSWLTERFGTNPSALWDDREMNRVVSEIRNAADVATEEIHAVLAENLEERISALDQSIEFITSATQIESTAAAVISAAQAFTLKKLIQEVPYPPPPRGFDKPFDGSEIDRVRHIPAMLRNPSDGVNVFDAFAEADASLDRTEYVLDQLAIAIDQEIQLAVDRARGK